MPAQISLNTFAQSDVGRGLTDVELEVILGLAEELQLSGAQVLFREGDRGDALYQVVSGEVEVVKRDAAGKERALASVGPGAVLGEMSLVHGGASRSATVRTTGPATLLKIPAARFQTLLAQDVVAALKVVRNVAAVMAQRLARVDQRVVDLLAQAEGAQHAELSDFQKILQNWAF